MFIEAIGLSAPLVLQFTTDELIPSKSIGQTLIFCAAVLLLMVCQAAGQAIRLRALEALRLDLNFKVSSGLFSHLLGLPSSFFASRHHGDLQSRFSSLDEIHRGISGALLATIFDAMVAVMLATLLFLYSPIIGALSVLCVGAYIATRSLMHEPTLAAHEGQIISHARRQSFLLESLRGIDTLKSYSALHVRSSEFSNLTAEAASDEFGVSHLSNVYQSISACIISASLVGTIGLGAWEVMSDNITLGMLFALLMYRSAFMSRMFGAFDAFMRIRMLSLHAQRVSEISAHKGGDTLALPGRCTSGSAVVASELEFSYPGARGPVLRSVSFTVPAGTSAGVVGRSGCGKTTLGKLVCGLLLPTGGSLTIGGEAVLGEDAIRRHGIAVVSQSDILFSGTILQNIVMWDSQIDIQRVKGACRDACVLDEIMMMPMGLHSPVGEGGSLLSGGQKQRIFLARALYKNPSILVLDEATSHLDVPTEAHVLNNMAMLSITRIHVAHRPQSIAACDQIIRLGETDSQNFPHSGEHRDPVACLT
ncbi:ABC transporter transmembrane domain-containing protein [Xanthomonas translucens pv. undulosa]|uniref:peptidase domain-containing ABC transporter n=1 Tax=Xanthomonas campestris pv. translucens TaxID=343 RepID=UPI003CF86B1C